ncbi:MAG TPA: nitroreductase family protein [Candidatus Methanoperedens sp.]|nr:nitroreductase family protein [Candidatus Methanoperedens sp.]
MPLPVNETLATIARRRSVRVFDGRPVPPQMLAALIAAANQAPSAHNSQSWRFLVLGPEKKRELAAFVSARSAQFPRPTNVLLRMGARTIASAPAVIAVANTGELMRHGAELFPIAGEHNRDFFRTMEIQGSAAAVQNLLLAATSLGLGAVWLGILYLMKDEVLALLGEPQGEFMAVIPLGYGATPAKSPKKRTDEEIVRRLP